MNAPGPLPRSAAVRHAQARLHRGIALSRGVTTVAVASLWLGACSLGPETDLHVRGTVRDASSDAPIAGAGVLVAWVLGFGNLQTRSASTDEFGAYVISVDGVICEDLQITAGAPGYQLGPSQDLACTGEVQVLDFALRPE